MPPSTPAPLPSRALSAAFNMAGDRVTVAGLARACGVTTSVVDQWLWHGGLVADSAMISAIRIAFYRAGVLLEHEPGDIDGVAVRLPDGWCVGLIGWG